MDEISQNMTQNTLDSSSRQKWNLIPKKNNQKIIFKIPPSLPYGLKDGHSPFGYESIIIIPKIISTIRMFERVCSWEKKKMLSQKKYPSRYILLKDTLSFYLFVLNKRHLYHYIFVIQK